MKKSVKSLMTLSIVFACLGYVFFICGPLIVQATGGSGFYYFDKVLLNVLFNFPYLFLFQNVRTIAGFVAFVVLLVLWIAWLLSVIFKKRARSIAPLIVGFVVLVAVFVLMDALLIDTTAYTNQSILEACISLLGQPNSPLVMIIFVFVSLACVSLAFVFAFIEALIEIFTPKVKYEEGESLDDEAKVEPIATSQDIMKLLQEPVADVNSEVAASPLEEVHTVEEVKQEPAPQVEIPVAPAAPEEPKEEVKPQPEIPPQPQPAPAPSPVPPQPFIFQQFFGTMPNQQVISPLSSLERPAQPEVKPEVNEEEKKESEEPVTPPAPQISEEEIRSLVRTEVTEVRKDLELKEIMHGELPTGHGNEIRNIVHDEVRSVANDEIVNSILNVVRQIVREEVNTSITKVVTAQKEKPAAPAPKKVEPSPVPAPVVAAPVVEAPKAEPTSVVAPVVVPILESTPAEPVVETPAEAQPVTEKPKIIRVPFHERCKIMSPEMRAHFNELKSEIMSYGVKSRVSNSGDTFRLHTKTYVKITIAGNSLKLYFALDPKKYADSTLPIADAGHKGIYQEIPLVFKVKSELSLRRAKGLIADAMAVDSLKQSDLEIKDWVQEIIDNADSIENED